MYTGMYNVSSPVTEISAHYFVCCRNGIYKGNVKPRKTSKKPLQQKETRKMGYIYILYVDELHSGQVTVRYISAHTDHELGPQELNHLSLPKSMKFL